MDTETSPIPRLRRHRDNEMLKAVQKHAFMSVNCCVGWLGVNVSSLWAFDNSSMEQRLHDVRMRDVIAQHNGLRQLKQYGTLITFPCPAQGEADVSVMVYSKVGRLDDLAQLSLFAGVLARKREAESMFHKILVVIVQVAAASRINRRCRDFGLCRGNQ